jgi:hypothetical protein
MTALDVGKKLVALCQQGKFSEAVASLYAPNVVSIEPFAPGGQSPRSEGLQACLDKGDWWVQNHTVHSAKIEGPFPHGDRFIVTFAFDVTAKAGPMAGKRFPMHEAGLYTVHDGKVTHEEFFYSMG